MWNRWQDPDTGTFLSEDPAQAGDNWYSYAGANPMTKLDRTGLYEGESATGQANADEAAAEAGYSLSNNGTTTSYAGPHAGPADFSTGLTPMQANIADIANNGLGANGSVGYDLNGRAQAYLAYHQGAPDPARPTPGPTPGPTSTPSPTSPPGPAGSTNPGANGHTMGDQIVDKLKGLVLIGVGVGEAWLAWEIVSLGLDAGGAISVGSGGAATAGGVAVAGAAVALATPVAIASAATLAQGLHAVFSQGNGGGGGGGGGDDKDNKPKLVSNPKHNANSASPEPKNVKELYDKSIEDNNGVRWAKGDNGVINRFSAPSNGEVHWNGSTAGPNPIRMDDIPIYIRRALK